MNEPLHPHFVLADGTYCHILADRLVIAKKELPKTIPEAGGKPVWFEIIGLGIAAAIMVFFFVMTIYAGYYLLASLMFLLGAYACLSAIRLIGFTDAKTILRSDILGVVYYPRRIGNDFFVVVYTSAQGKVARRRLAIYDSQECLQQALTVMTAEGLLQRATG